MQAQKHAFTKLDIKLYIVVKIEQSRPSKITVINCGPTNETISNVVDNTGRDKRRNTGRIRKGMRGRESCGNWKEWGIKGD